MKNKKLILNFACESSNNMKNQTPTLEELNRESRRKLAPFKVKFPQLFSKLEWLETGDGWDNIIDFMSLLIQINIDYKIPEELKEQIYYTQIKEKFGLLRVYISNDTPYIKGVIDMASAISGTICEKCGQRGTIKTISGWVSVLCKNCQN